MLEALPASSDQARAVALDMDGVIVDGMPFHVTAWVYAFNSFGLNVEERWFYELEGVVPFEVISEVLYRLQVEMSDNDRRYLYDTKLAHFHEHYRTIAIPGIHTLVETLLGFGFRLAVVTGSEPQIALKVLETLGVAQSFSTVISAADVARGKPAPDPYLKAVELLGVAPSNCLVIENAPAGIMSAKRAGLTCLAVTTTLDAHALAMADVIVPSLQECLVWIHSEVKHSGGSGVWLTR
ncbi:MAG: HAD family phosphatase [Anaerolineae bacterium]|nr:HAD family phosphatase [Anaerolineae bacterium]